MKRASKLVIYGLVIVGIAIAIITTNIFPLTSWATANNGTTQTETTTPHGVTMKLKASNSME